MRVMQNNVNLTSRVTGRFEDVCVTFPVRNSTLNRYRIDVELRRKIGRLDVDSTHRRKIDVRFLTGMGAAGEWMS